LKIVPKYNLDTIGKINNLLHEPEILKGIKKNNFVPEIISSFQDYDNIYLVTTFYDGPSLTEIVNKKLSENQIQFISACIVLALKNLRENQIIHRDLTFQNIMLDKDNYFNFIDFSFSVNYTNRNSRNFTCFTCPSYTPPEIIKKSNYDYNSDYYRFGIIIFYLIFKRFPIHITKFQNLKEYISHNYPTKNYSENLLNFTVELIETDMKKRIGYKNIDEIMNHSFFYSLDWEKMESKKIISPFKFNRPIFREHECKKFNKTKSGVDIYAKLIKTKYYEKSWKDFEFSKNKE
jgi:serine/threonine protein kinase